MSQYLEQGLTSICIIKLHAFDYTAAMKTLRHAAVSPTAG